ncbi:MAG TPA: signal peptide peptidase SppA [Vicinamibacterales bacterium]|nr:signal peptide peptidase SppA [Vicinamibacterales bacterium]
MAVRRGVLIVFILIGLAMMASCGGLLVLGLVVGGSTPMSVPDNATLYLPLNAPFGELAPVSVFNLVNRRPTVAMTIDAIRKAKRDTRVKTLVITPSAAGALWGQVQEVRAALEDFRQSGKPVTAYLEFGGAQEYYLASAADRVVLMPAGQLDLTGIATYELFFRGAFDKLGVTPDLLHIGEYKTAANTFTERNFTKAHLEMTKSLNRDWYDELVRAIAASRKKSVEEIRKVIDSGPFQPEAALAAGLIDQVAYEDELDDKAPIQGTRRLEASSYQQAYVAGASSTAGAKIAVLYAVGTIASGKSTLDGSGGVVGSETFVDWLRKVRVDSAVRAIVIRIDSPGGSAIASEVIWRELMLTRDMKPLIVSMGDVAASGGYYIAVPAHAIVAQPGTLTGSIGVVTGKFALGGALDKIGVGTGVVSDGKYADIYSPFRPFSAEERARIEEQLRSTYELFLSRVAEGRKTTKEKIDTIAQGRVWTGRQALERGLVDELGGLDRAIRLAKERAKLDVNKDVELLVYPQEPSIFDIFENSFGGMTSASARMSAAAKVGGAEEQARTIESLASVLGRFRRGEALMLMPNVFVR